MHAHASTYMSHGSVCHLRCVDSRAQLPHLKGVVPATVTTHTIAIVTFLTVGYSHSICGDLGIKLVCWVDHPYLHLLCLLLQHSPWLSLGKVFLLVQPLHIVLLDTCACAEHHTALWGFGGSKDVYACTGCYQRSACVLSISPFVR